MADEAACVGAAPIEDMQETSNLQQEVETDMLKEELSTTTPIKKPKTRKGGIARELAMLREQNEILSDRETSVILRKPASPLKPPTPARSKKLGDSASQRASKLGESRATPAKRKRVVATSISDSDKTSPKKTKGEEKKEENDASPQPRAIDQSPQTSPSPRRIAMRKKRQIKNGVTSPKKPHIEKVAILNFTLRFLNGNFLS